MFEGMVKFFRNFAHNRRGNVALIFALALPVIGVATASVIDFERAQAAKQRLQTAADSAALGAAKELRLANSTPSQVSAVAQQIALATLEAKDSAAVVTATVLSTNDGVQVQIDEVMPSSFTRISALSNPHLHASAVARLSGGTTVCLLALDPTMPGALGLDTAILSSPGCGTYVDSNSANALTATGISMIKSAMICSGGGVSASSKALTPQALLDCPPLSDPLALRPAPTFSGCDYTNLVLNSGPQTLIPGTYCGGITSGNGSKVMMSNGTYIIKDGPLKLDKKSSLTMLNAGVYLTGAGAILAFDNTTTLNLSAPISGNMAGIIFFEDRAAPLGQQHYISSRAADKIEGTVYLSRNSLVIGEKPTLGSLLAFACQVIPGYKGQCPPEGGGLATTSAWTVIIAKQILINAGVDLVLNANYGVSSVPAPPEFFSKAASSPRLVQ